MQPLFTVLKNLTFDKLFSLFLSWKDKKDNQSFCNFLSVLYENNAQDDFSSYVADKILYDVNAFSLACAKKQPPSPFVVKAFTQDLKEVCNLLADTKTHDAFAIGNSLREGIWGGENSVKNLQNFYNQYGYGPFIRHRAFFWEKDSLCSIEKFPPVQLFDLKDYKEEKKIIASNIENFLDGLPCADMLLYGERGTGKSSTVHAMVNCYYQNGLRLVELSKENMLQLPLLKQKLREIPLKFIVYIDDLSLNAGDERISSLKTVLEGCASGHTGNVMIVATSNRRHLIDEKFSQREDSVHASDSMQEELSLSDRFGISVLFTSTNQAEYLSIIKQLMTDKGLTMPESELRTLAERWAIAKGGRSPRRAKQFIDFVYSCLSKNLPVIF